MRQRITSLIEQRMLDRKLNSEQKQGKLSGGEHCFREDLPWYRLNVGYTNPLNFGNVHAELQLIHLAFALKLAQLVEAVKHPLIFYGIGVGDTEIALVDYSLKIHKASIDIIGIDVNRVFLENFIIALQNRELEPGTPKITFRGFHALFNQIERKDVPSCKNTHVCLGGTIGNFEDQAAFIASIRSISKKGDHLILAVQQNAHIRCLFEKYRQNPLFPDFVLNYVPKNQREELIWELDENKNQIIAKHQGIVVFRTTKYELSRLRTMVKEQGYTHLVTLSDEEENCALQVYQAK